PSKPGRIARISKEQSALLERALQTPSYDRQVGKKHPVLGKPSGFRFFEKRIPHPIAAVVEGVPPLPGETAARCKIKCRTRLLLAVVPEFGDENPLDFDRF